MTDQQSMELKATRDALRRRCVGRMSTKTHTGFVWLPRSDCTLCGGTWLTADVWERHAPGCLAVDPEKLAPTDERAHQVAMKVTP